LGFLSTQSLENQHRGAGAAIVLLKFFSRCFRLALLPQKLHTDDPLEVMLEPLIPHWLIRRSSIDAGVSAPVSCHFHFALWHRVPILVYCASGPQSAIRNHSRVDRAYS
jgi:hypothetical protein